MGSDKVHDIYVTAATLGTSRGRLRLSPLEFPCALGRSGLTDDKHEGDGATPIGVWPLRQGYYRPDRLGLPQTALPFRPLAPNCGWCDDPSDPRYNRPAKLPCPTHAEALWREDGLYDLMVILGYNDDPVRPGRGSAIFFHIARPNDAPTQGCVALSRPAMVKILSLCAPPTFMHISVATA
ncbi:MAG: L,D-transpeptidase family protein [Hyphomicrobiales bacterium]